MFASIKYKENRNENFAIKSKFRQDIFIASQNQRDAKIAKNGYFSPILWIGSLGSDFDS